jgi:hypothetical protein
VTRWQLLTDWPAFHDLSPIPAGTILEGDPPRYFGRDLPSPMPIEAAALDDQAAAQMRYWYGLDDPRWYEHGDQRHRLRFGDGVSVPPRPQPRPRQQGDQIARWRLREDWPGPGINVYIPADEIVEATVRDGEIEATWQGNVLPTPLPICAVALDALAARLMLSWHRGRRHLLHFGAGVRIDEQV